MSTSIDLQDMFSYSLLPIIILIVIIIILILILILTRRKPKPVSKLNIVKPTNINDIKNRYLQEINNLLLLVNENKITNRSAYQKLSKLIRNFVYEVTGLKVQYYTLSEIKTLRIPILSTLVEEYYHPEFAKESTSDITSSITKTREVVVKWK